MTLADIKPGTEVAPNRCHSLFSSEPSPSTHLTLTFIDGVLICWSFLTPSSEGFFHSLRRLFCNPSAITPSGWPACLPSQHPCKSPCQVRYPRAPSKRSLEADPVLPLSQPGWVSLWEWAALACSRGTPTNTRQDVSTQKPPKFQGLLLTLPFPSWTLLWTYDILSDSENYESWDLGQIIWPFRASVFPICRMGPAAPTLLAYQVKEWIQWENWLLGTIKLPSSLGRTPGLVLSVSTGSREAEQ